MGLVDDDCWEHAMGDVSVEYRPDPRRRNSTWCSMNSSRIEFSERTGSSQPDLGDLCDFEDSWFNTAQFNDALQSDIHQHGDPTSTSRSDHQTSRLPHSRSQHTLALASPTSRQDTLREYDKLQCRGINKTDSSNTIPNTGLPSYSGAALLSSRSAKYQTTDGKSLQAQSELPSRSQQTIPGLPPPRPSKPGQVKVSPPIIKRKRTQTKEFWSPLLKRQTEFQPKTMQEIETPPKFPEVTNQPTIPSKSTEARKQQPISLKTTPTNNPPPIPPKQDENSLPKKLSNLNNELSNIAPRTQQSLPPKTTEMSKDQQTLPKQLPESKNEPPNRLPFTARRDQPPLPPKPSETIKFSHDQQTEAKTLSELNNEPSYLLPFTSRRDQPPLPPKLPETIKFSSKRDQQTLPKQIEPCRERKISPVLPAIPPKSTEAVRPLPIPPIQTHRTRQTQLPELNTNPQNVPLLPPREQPPALPQRLRSTAAASSSDDETSEAPLTQSSPRSPSIQNPNPRHRGSSSREPHCILQRHTLTVVSVFSFLLSVLSVALLALVQVNPFVYSWKDRTFKENLYKPCVTCFSLMSNLASSMFDNDLKSLTMKIEKEEVFCCAEDNQQMSSLLKLVIKQQDYEQSAENSESNEAIINDHVVLDPQTGRTKKDVYNNYIMRIRSKDNTITDSKDSKAAEKDFFVTISAKGWYYVYSSIFYNTTCANLEFKTFEHFIVRYVPQDKAKSGVLTKTVHTCCKKCVDEKRSIFTGGVFELFQGDKLYAAVTDITAIHHDIVPSSYMGYSMLGE